MVHSAISTKAQTREKSDWLGGRGELQGEAECGLDGWEEVGSEEDPPKQAGLRELEKRKFHVQRCVTKPL